MAFGSYYPAGETPAFPVTPAFPGGRILLEVLVPIRRYSGGLFRPSLLRSRWL